MIDVKKAVPVKVSGTGKASRSILYEDVYERLFQDLITGQLEPGRPITVRGMAAQLGVSPMPVREALRRLAAQGALHVTDTRRVTVTPMDRSRYDQVCLGRTLLEPELAVHALAHLTKTDIARLERLDHRVDAAIATGDASAYGTANWRFHSYIYAKADQPILFALVENLWLQVGPFMRQVAARFGTANLEDQHELAIEAIRRNDADLLRSAIRQDIFDGMSLIEGEF